jgi:hypothetical protein
MNIVSRIKDLNLPMGQYVVFGSAVMEVHGIRPAKDIDIVIDQGLYQELKRRGWRRKWNFKRVLTCKALQFENNEAFTNLYWKDYRITTGELINNAELIDGVPFMSIQDYLLYKKHLPREKDKKDVILLENYLSARVE